MGMIMRCGYWVLCVFCRDVYGEECLLGVGVALQAIHNHCCRIYFCVKYGFLVGSIYHIEVDLNAQRQVVFLLNRVIKFYKRHSSEQSILAKKHVEKQCFSLFFVHSAFVFTSFWGLKSAFCTILPF